MKRRNLTKSERAEVAAKTGGACKDCGSTEGPFDYEHEIPLWAGGKDEVENIVLRCRQDCHKPKTQREAKDRAKSNRIRLKEKGGYGHRRKYIAKVGGGVKKNPNAKKGLPF